MLWLTGCIDGTEVPQAVSSVVSTPITLSLDGSRIWSVNPDANSVTLLDTATLDVIKEYPVGAEPWAVSAIADGAVVMNRAEGSLTVIRNDAVRHVKVGPEPGGVVATPDGTRAYVTLSADDLVIEVDLLALAVTKRTAVSRVPWAIALLEESDREGPTLVVTHRFARLGNTSSGRLEALLSIVENGHVREVTLPTVNDRAPNALESLALHESTVWVPHLLDRPTAPREFHSTLSAGIASLSVDGSVLGRIDLTDPGFSSPVNFARAVAITEEGTTLYVVLAGNDSVMGIDVSDIDAPRLLGFWKVGNNPRGIALSSDETRAFVMNYLSRDVSVLDLTSSPRTELARVVTSAETLTTEVLEGKRLFNSASDPRMSHLGWVSCGSCHVDGGADGITWSMPDGPRQTMPLWSAGETPPYHASATRDEVQDFEHDIRELFGGRGLAFGPPPTPLGAPSGGTSANLDALAAFVRMGIRVPSAPSADATAVQAGREVFAGLGCAECHGGRSWTRSRLPGEVGTLAPAGEQEVLEVLVDIGTFVVGEDVLGDRGFDVPSLLGLHASTPYLHDGSAADLHTVLANEVHVGRPLGANEESALVAFLLSIDDATEPFE